MGARGLALVVLALVGASVLAWPGLLASPGLRMAAERERALAEAMRPVPVGGRVYWFPWNKTLVIPLRGGRVQTLHFDPWLGSPPGVFTTRWARWAVNWSLDPNLTVFERRAVEVPAEEAYRWIMQVENASGNAGLVAGDLRAVESRPPRPLPGGRALVLKLGLWFGATLTVIMYPVDPGADWMGRRVDLFFYVYGTVENTSEWWTQGVGRTLYFNGLVAPLSYDEYTPWFSPLRSLQWWTHDPLSYTNILIRLYGRSMGEKGWWRVLTHMTRDFMYWYEKAWDRGPDNTVPPGPGWLRVVFSKPEYTIHLPLNATACATAATGGVPPGTGGYTILVFKNTMTAAQRLWVNWTDAGWRVVLDIPWLYQWPPADAEELYWLVVGRPALSLIEHLLILPLKAQLGVELPLWDFEIDMMRTIIPPPAPYDPYVRLPGDGATPLTIWWTGASLCMGYSLAAGVWESLVFDRPVAILAEPGHAIPVVAVTTRMPAWPPGKTPNATVFRGAVLPEKPFFMLPIDLDGDGRRDMGMVIYDSAPSVAQSRGGYTKAIQHKEYAFYPGSTLWLGTLMRVPVDVAGYAGLTNYTLSLPPAFRPPAYWLLHYKGEKPHGYYYEYYIEYPNGPVDPCTWYCPNQKHYNNFRAASTLPAGEAHYLGMYHVWLPSNWSTVPYSNLTRIFNQRIINTFGNETTTGGPFWIEGGYYMSPYWQVIPPDYEIGALVYALKIIYGGVDPPTPAPAIPVEPALSAGPPPSLRSLLPWLYEHAWELIPNPYYRETPW